MLLESYTLCELNKVLETIVSPKVNAQEKPKIPRFPC